MPLNAIRTYSIALIVLFFCTIPAGAERYILNSYPELQEGFPLTGFIDATDANNDSLLQASEISAWFYQYRSSMEPNVGTSFIDERIEGKVGIADGQIFLDPTFNEGALTLVSEEVFGETVIHFLEYRLTPATANYQQLFSQCVITLVECTPGAGFTNIAESATFLDPTGTLPMPIANGRMVIATVPEPGGVLLAVIGWACLTPRLKVSIRSGRLRIRRILVR